jgi:spore coat protein U-like protein
MNMNANMNKLALVIGAMAMAGGAWAATESGNLAVGATVQNACAIGPGSLSFGTNLKLAVAANGTIGTTDAVDGDSGSTISIICTNGAEATITGDAGANNSGGRRMVAGAGEYLAYALYTDALAGTELGAVPLSGIAYNGTGSTTTNTTVYGKILGSSLAAAKAGVYGDTVILTITYSL